MLPDDIELAFIRIFSVAGNKIGMSTSKSERRERVRQALYLSGRANEPFMGEGINFGEAFRVAFGERLDRRAATRDTSNDGMTTCVNCGHKKSAHTHKNADGHLSCSRCPCLAFTVEQDSQDDSNEEEDEHG